jgi:chromate reductase, NAD(P)H dehydrogenase (quinone)
MIRIIGISGSLRRDSYNAALLRAAVVLAPRECEIRVESIAGIPLYTADDEAAIGIPPVVSSLREAIASADGLLIVKPEYNNGFLRRHQEC